MLELDLAEAEPNDDAALAAARGRYEAAVARFLGVADRGRPADAWLLQTAQLAWRSRVLARLTADLRSRMFAAAEDEAVRVFAANLRDVLLAAPAGNRATLGLDPGLRTGVKVAVVDGTGKVVATDTIYPHAPARKWDEALRTLVGLARKHHVELVAIGNGTASRETDKLAAELLKQLTAPDAAAATGTPSRRRSWSPRPEPPCTPRRRWPRRSCRAWMSPCAAPCPSPGGCRTRWRSS